jgi:hypothetical protein
MNASLAAYHFHAMNLRDEYQDDSAVPEMPVADPFQVNRV